MSVDFDPVRLGPRRPRVDPLAIGVVVVGVALAIAVAKPWDALPPAPRPSLAIVAPSITPVPSASPTRTPRPTPTATPPGPSWADFAPAVTAHDAWGVRAILVGTGQHFGTPDGSNYLERWAPATTGLDEGEPVTVERGEGSVVALGVTSPRGQSAQDVRIWRVRRGDRLEWVDARRVESGGADGSVLLVRPGVAGRSYEPWEAGEYLIDVLGSDGIRRIAVGVTGQFGNVPAPDDPGAAPPRIVSAEESDPSAVRIGMFATVDGVGVPLAAARSRQLDAGQAWLDLTRPDGMLVATAHLPRATGLGVMLTEHAFVQEATIRRLAPDLSFDAPEFLGGISEAHGRTPYVIFPARDSDVWDPGVYAITVAWTDPAGAHDDTWHVELRPGPG